MPLSSVADFRHRDGPVWAASWATHVAMSLWVTAASGIRFQVGTMMHVLKIDW